MKTAVFIQCYGVIDSQIRNEIEMRGLHDYFLKLSEFLRLNKQSLNAVVLGGGYNGNQTSEAESSWKYLKNIAPDLSDLPIYMQTIGHSALDNLCYNFLTIYENLFPERLILISDSNRMIKTGVLARTLFSEYIENIEVYGFDRTDIHPQSTPEFQLQKSLINELNSPQLHCFKNIIRATINQQNPSKL